MPDHPSGNPYLIQQHKVIQRQGDQELNGGEAKGSDLPDALEAERGAGVVIPDDGSAAHLPKMKPATAIDGESGGDGSTGGGANPGP
jgi:hypothetical protein